MPSLRDGADELLARIAALHAAAEPRPVNGAHRLERGLAKALRAAYDPRPDALERAARRLRGAAAP